MPFKKARNETLIPEEMKGAGVHAVIKAIEKAWRRLWHPNFRGDIKRGQNPLVEVMPQPDYREHKVVRRMPSIIRWLGKRMTAGTSQKPNKQ